MRIRMPSRKVCREFHLTYELKGAQRGVDVLARYYRIRRMEIILDGRRVGNGDEASYRADKHVAYFTKRGLDKFNVSHEFFHHLVAEGVIEIAERAEEKAADSFAKEIFEIARTGKRRYKS